ncbi:MAG: hypothetical protein FWE38_00550 [Firmicutes bacterium]|nr:hypothetical protein [Bacillota bacterium]
MKNKSMKSFSVLIVALFAAVVLVGCSGRDYGEPPSWYGQEPPSWYDQTPPDWWQESAPDWWEDRNNPPPWHGQNPPAWWDVETGLPEWDGVGVPSWWDIENNRPYWYEVEPPAWWRISRAGAELIEYLGNKYSENFVVISGTLVVNAGPDFSPTVQFYGFHISPVANKNIIFPASVHYADSTQTNFNFFDDYSIALLYHDIAKIRAEVSPHINIHWFFPEEHEPLGVVLIEIELQAHWPFHPNNLGNQNVILSDFHQPASLLYDLKRFLYDNAERYKLRQANGDWMSLPNIHVRFGYPRTPAQWNQQMVSVSILNAERLANAYNWEDYSHMLDYTRDQFIEAFAQILYDVYGTWDILWGDVHGFEHRYIKLK